LAEEHNREVETTQRLPKKRTAPRKGMNVHQVEAWYDGLGTERRSRGDGVGARSAGLLSGLLNVLLVYAFVQFAVSLPSLDKQRQTAGQERSREEASKRNLRVESFDAQKARKDGKR
jgi:hypothetical protein